MRGAVASLSSIDRPITLNRALLLGIVVGRNSAEEKGATLKAQNSAIDSAQYREGTATAGVGTI